MLFETIEEREKHKEKFVESEDLSVMESDKVREYYYVVVVDFREPWKKWGDSNF